MCPEYFSIKVEQIGINFWKNLILSQCNSNISQVLVSYMFYWQFQIDSICVTCLVFRGQQIIPRDHGGWLSEVLSKMRTIGL